MTYQRQKAKMVYLGEGLIECPCGTVFQTNFLATGNIETLAGPPNMEKIGGTWHPLCPHCLCLGSTWFNDEITTVHSRRIDSH